MIRYYLLKHDDDYFIQRGEPISILETVNCIRCVPIASILSHDDNFAVKLLMAKAFDDYRQNHDTLLWLAEQTGKRSTSPDPKNNS